MARAILYLEAKANHWLSRQSSRTSASESLKDGLRAYALRQAALQRAFLISFAEDFDTALQPSSGNTPHLVSEVIADDDDYTPDDEELVDII